VARLLAFDFLAVGLCGQVRAEKWYKVRATEYSAWFQGRVMADGYRYRNAAFTAASRTLPFGTILLVSSVKTHRSVVVVVTDRGPWHYKFSLDLSRAAAKEIGLTDAKGWIWVRYRRL